MDTIRAVADRLRAEAEMFRTRAGDPGRAQYAEAIAAEIDAAIVAEGAEVVSLQRACDITGYSDAHLRSLTRSGTLPMAASGRIGVPRYRTQDLLAIGRPGRRPRA